MDLPQLLNHHSHNRSRYVTVTNHPDDHPNFRNPPRHSETLRNYHHQQQQPQPNQQHFHHQNYRHLPPPPPPNLAPFQPPPPNQQSPFKTPTHQGYNAAEKPQYSYANPSRERPNEQGNRSSRPSSSIVCQNFSPAQHRLGFDDHRVDRRPVILRGRSPEFDQETRSGYWEQSRVLKDNPPEVSQKFRLDFNSGASQKFQPGHSKFGSPYKTTSRFRLETESGSSRFRVEYGDLFEPMKNGDERNKGYYCSSDSVSSSGMSIREVEFLPRQSLASKNSESRSEIYDGRHEEELIRTGRRDMVYGNQRRFYDRKVLRGAPSSPYKRGASEIVNGDRVHFVSAQREYPGPESGRFGHGNRGDSYQNNRTPRKQYQKKSALLRIQKPYQRNIENEKFGHYDNQDSPGSSSFRHRDQYAYTGREIDEEQVERSPVHLNVSFKSNSLVAKAVATPPRASNDPDTDLTPSNFKVISKECNSDRDCLSVDLAKPIGGITDLGGSAEAVNSGKEIVQTEEKVISVEDLGDSNLLVTLNPTGQLLENNETQKSPVGAEPQKDIVGSVEPPLKVMKKKKVVKKIVKKVVRPRPRVVLNFPKKKLDTPLASRACVFEPKDSINPMAVASEVNRPGTVKMVEAAQLGSKSEEHVTDLKSNTHVTADNTENTSSTVVESPWQEEIILDKGPGCAPNSSQGLHTISERNRDLAKSYILSYAANAEHEVNHIQSHQTGDALSGYNTDQAFSNSGHTKMYENGSGVSYAATSAVTMNDATCSKREFVVGEEIPNDISRSSKNGDMSSPREVAINVHSSHREENIISSTSSADCFIKQVSTDAAIRLSKVDATETSADTSVSVGKNKVGTPSKRNKRARQRRKVRSRLDFSRESSSNLDATNVFKSATSMDPSCELAASTSGNSDDGLEPGRDIPSLSSPYGISKANIASRDNVDSAFRDSSLQCSKRRRVSTFGLAPQAEEKSVDRSLSCTESPSTSNDILLQHDMNISAIAARTSCAATNVDKGGVVKAIDMQVRREEEEQAEAEAVGVVVLRDQDAACDGTLPHPVSLSVQHPNTVGTSLCTSVKESDGLLGKGDLLNSSNYLSTPADCSEATSVNEAINCVPGLLTDTGSSQTLLNISDVDVSVTASVSKILSGTFLDDKKLEKKPVNDSCSDTSAKNSFPQSSKRQSMPDCISGGQKVERNTSLTLLGSRSPSEGLNVKSLAYIRQKNQHGHSMIAKEFTGPSTSEPATMKKRAFPTIAGARTWHRSASTSSLPGTDPFTRNVPLQKQLLKRDRKFQSTSYVRKGNSLVRNPSLSSALSQDSGFRPVYQLNSVGSDVSKKSIEAENRVTGNSHGLMSRERKESSDDPTSLVQSGKKLPSSAAVRSEDFMLSASAGLLSSGCGDINSETIILLDNNDTAKLVGDPSTIEVLENQSQVNESNNPAVLNEGNLTSLNTKKIVYVKCKSNQLVATSNSVDLPIVKADKSQAPSSDGYYKRKNQLIRTSLESNRREPVFMSDKSGGQMTLNAASSTKLSRKRLLKVVAKTFKRSRNSLVWTSALLKKNNSGPPTHQKVFPQLFPWKRTAYCRSFMHNWGLFSKSSTMAISRNLLVSRQRDTVYTRSINGFSLRKSKVLSVGGSSLKWSKSIERHSKKANEEATLAVAAVERKKREQKGATYPSSGSRNKNHSSRERIFRVGLFRYKMDPSRRTLQRISDDKSPGAPSSSLDKDAKKLYIPRRLVIGNNEYVRIGNGNQLIRDPKKRTRILANEKVRWSLHTARLRLAKKRKYCQFFTRFGRCNKDSGKCPYLHDPSKIAVCTKFLKGLCSNANCKLTHKVIPERMPDCSYYLQGLCTNKSCPYRHVNVNPKASTCDGFLRGYCADGDECRKKHSYVCPSFEATGTCPGRSKCKLHHPKNRVHAKKKRRSGEPRNSTGRYFGSPDPNAVSDKCFAQENKYVLLEEGTCADYIAMGVSDDDTGESINQRATRTLFCDSGSPSDFEDLDDLAELIKPIRLMAAKSNSVAA